jgi:hypothetical protein
MKWGADAQAADAEKAADNDTDREVYGTKMNIFAKSDAVPGFSPADTTSVDMHVTT